jgi:hypothetical protein
LYKCGPPPPPESLGPRRSLGSHGLKKLGSHGLRELWSHGPRGFRDTAYQRRFGAKDDATREQGAKEPETLGTREPRTKGGGEPWTHGIQRLCILVTFCRQEGCHHHHGPREPSTPGGYGLREPWTQGYMSPVTQRH